jgi:cbb3-type cytochrome oxidase cytochrome c subunit
MLDRKQLLLVVCGVIVLAVAIAVLIISNAPNCEDMLADYEKKEGNSKSAGRGILITKCGQSILEGVDK